MDALRKAEIELDREMHKQVDIIYSAAAIAFSRYWDKNGWGPLRIRRIFDEILDDVEQYLADNTKTFAQEFSKMREVRA